MKNKKAIALISGGLDSVLAAKIISEQGIDVIGVSFLTPFNGNNFEQSIKSLSKELGIDIKLVNISKDFLEMLASPRYGYGKNLNPCIDCRILELKKAYQLMKELGADFIITGEVLGQRPMSQNKNSMELIEKKSGVGGLLVRPLCGKLFAPTTAEKEGWIDRNKLLNINGRSRKKQYELAKKYNISGYGAPAGGCLLTDPGFSLIIKDLLNNKMLDIHSIGLIKNGRYFTVSDSFKLVVGRDHQQNQALMKLASKKDIIFEPETKGPVAIAFGKKKTKDIDIACRIVAYYCKDKEVNVSVKTFRNVKTHLVNTEKISEQELLKYRV
jgi:tRNA-specific 2-thiouridylase